MTKVTPTYSIASYIFRNDDGTEATATNYGTLNTPANIDVDTTKRIRLLVRETAGGAINNVGFTWQYKHTEGANIWIPITASSNVVRAVTSQLVDDDDCTDILNLGVFTFITDNNGQCEDGVTTSAVCDFAGNDATEVELSFQILSGGVSSGDEIQFRVLIDGTVPTLSVTPTAIAVSTINFDATHATFAVAGGTVNLNRQLRLLASPASIAVTGGDVGFSYTKTIQATGASIAVTGGDVAFLMTENMPATPAAFVVTGGDALFKRQLVMGALPASISVSGSTDLNRLYTLDALPASIAVTGGDVAFEFQQAVFTLDALPATFVVSGANAVIYTPWYADANHFTVDENDPTNHTADGWHFHPTLESSYGALGATISVVGGNAQFNYKRVMGALPASIAVSGGDIDTSKSYVMGALPASISVSTVDTGVHAARLLSAQQADFVVSGADASLPTLKSYPANTAAFIVTGGDVSLLYHRRFAAEQADYVVAGSNAAINQGKYIGASGLDLTVTGGDVTLTYNVPQFRRIIIIS